ncbi:site-specific integrase [Candidatus Spongiihabitans sp.]|uniref:site-specific integrase n=1 Tax=Candidatus Spongiihabitans sp. TaxID=3101308 RepID=UPI003C701968
MLQSFNINDTYTDILSSVLADNTRIAYDKGWHLWQRYCNQNNITALPANPSDVARFLVQTATKPGANGKLPALGTVILWRSAINRKHVDQNAASPTNHPEVARVCKGLARLRSAPPRQVKALREHHIKTMLDKCPDTLIGKRDAAIIALGFAAALRRSEICGLTIDDLEIIDDEERPRMFLHIRKSKTDQEGLGQKIAIPEGKKLKPIKYLQDWLSAAGILSGPVFQTMFRGGKLRGSHMHPSDVPRIVKHYAAEIGLDASEIAGHSLRAGFVTSAAVHGARIDKIMEITRHRNPATVMKYIRDADSLNDHAGDGFL